MFIENKYFKWYNSIISNAKSRISVGYIEKHHIVPKSLGGSNSVENLVSLTAKEHYLCHRLLTKFTSGKNKRKMTLALNRMLYGKNRYVPNSNIYEKVRKEAIEELRNLNIGQKRSKETGIKISLKLKGRKLGPQCEEHINKRRQKLVGSKRSTETKKKMSTDRTGIKQRPEHIDKRKEKLIGKIRSEESKIKYKESKTGKKNPRATPVTINGKIYDTKAQARRELNISLGQLNELISHS